MANQVSPTRSMGTLLGIMNSKAAVLDAFLGTLGEKEIDTEDVAYIKELRDDIKAKFAKVESKWIALSEADTDPFKDEGEHDKCKGDYEKATLTLEKYLKAAKAALDRARNEGTATQEGAPTSGGGSGAIKIDEILKPEELLSSEMNLEEADQWFDSYRAYITFNKRNMAKLEISVRRQLLNKSLDPKMVSALRTHKDITPTTKIDAPNGCLDKLRAIFLEKNPLWLRRHAYFRCVQAKGETVDEWWSKKLDKARECLLADITEEQINLLELIRGVQNPNLKREFLKQKDPKLDDLLQIAKNWQRSSDVGKNLDTPVSSTVDSRKTSNSTYKKGKAKDWQNKSGDKTNSNKSGGKSDKSGGKDSKCHWCGQANHPKRNGQPDRDQCKAKGVTCSKCGKVGHFGSVCLSKPGNSQAGSKTGRVKVVQCKRTSTKVIDDSEPTPLMENVEVKPINGKNKPSIIEVFPDTGCQQSIVAEDLIDACGLILDRSKRKKITAVDGGEVPCTGSTTFQATYH